MPYYDYCVSVGLQWRKGKIGKLITVYQRELFKKIPRLGTFCTQSVNEELNLGEEEIGEIFSCRREIIILRDWWQNAHGVTTKERGYCCTRWYYRNRSIRSVALQTTFRLLSEVFHHTLCERVQINLFANWRWKENGAEIGWAIFCEKERIKLHLFTVESVAVLGDRRFECKLKVTSQSTTNKMGRFSIYLFL